MKNSTLLIAIVVLVLLVGGFVYFNSGEKVKINNTSWGNAQEVTLSYKNYNYYPQEVRVKAGEPVRISLDSSVGGCYRSFTIKQLGIAKYLASPRDYVEFTPEKGTYKFACSMGMGFGTLIAE